MKSSADFQSQHHIDSEWSLDGAAPYVIISSRSGTNIFTKPRSSGLGSILRLGQIESYAESNGCMSGLPSFTPTINSGNTIRALGTPLKIHVRIYPATIAVALWLPARLQQNFCFQSDLLREIPTIRRPKFEPGTTLTSQTPQPQPRLGTPRYQDI